MTEDESDDLDDGDEFQGAEGDDISTPTSEFLGAVGEDDSDGDLDSAYGDLSDGDLDDEPANMFDEDDGEFEGGLDENEGSTLDDEEDFSGFRRRFRG